LISCNPNLSKIIDLLRSFNDDYLNTKLNFLKNKSDNDEFTAKLQRIRKRKQEINIKKFGPAYSEIHDKFKNLILKYKDRSYIIPDLSIEKNIFKPSPLLMTNQEISKQKLQYDLNLGKNKDFMSKIRTLTEPENNAKVKPNTKVQNRTLHIENQTDSLVKLTRSINKTKQEITQTKETIDLMRAKVFPPTQQLMNRPRRISRAFKETNSSRNTNNETALFSLYDTMMTTGNTLDSQESVDLGQQNSYKQKGSRKHLIKLVNTKEYKKMFTNSSVQRIDTEQFNQLENLYNNIDLNNFNKIDQEGIVKYFSTFYNHDQKTLQAKSKIEPGEILKTINKFQKKSDQFNLKGFKQHYYFTNTDIKVNFDQLEYNHLI
jgi:hypothetical protein